MSIDFIDIFLPVGVGPKAAGGNNRVDVTRVQERLNDWMPPELDRIPRPYGTMNRQTEQAIRSFQSIVVGMKRPDGVIEPVKKTLQALNDPRSKERWHRANLAEPVPERSASPRQTSISWEKELRSRVQGSQFDSTLTRDGKKAVLELDLRLLLKPIPEGIVFDADRKMFVTQRWNTHEWIAYKTRLAREAGTFWSGKFWLVPPESARSLTYVNNLGERWRVPVECRLRVHLATTRGHTKVLVAHLGQPATSEEALNRQLRRAHGGNAFRSHAQLYDQDDLDPVNRGTGLRQRTHVHEVGHAIGQPHIGQMTANVTSALQCTLAAIANPEQGTNSGICYGATAAEKQNVMGMGERLTAVNAQPWQQRILQHDSGALGFWEVKMTPQKRTRVK
ncbi:MAG TPA: hypothetical protein VKU85_20735 [bacterium]|nr:hypothetical protein [bacterium]